MDTIEEGIGFPAFGVTHLCWLTAGIVFTILLSMYYRRCNVNRRRIVRIVLTALLLADEIFKHTMLIIGDNWTFEYLPLHLCSINIFLIAIHAWKPTRLLGHFLYLVCIPGAVAALLFCTWATLPPLNFMYIHSFTIHILLVLYPVMLTAGGDIRPQAREFWKCILLLLAMAVPIYGVNLLCDTNFMFLMYPEPGNPLLWFEEHWGNHLYGYPILIAAVMAVMYAPTRFLGKECTGAAR